MTTSPVRVWMPISLVWCFPYSPAPHHTLLAFHSSAAFQVGFVGPQHGQGLGMLGRGVRWAVGPQAGPVTARPLVLLQENRVAVWAAGRMNGC